MQCSGNCGKDLEKEGIIYQVRAGNIQEVVSTHSSETEGEFIPTEDIGYYCSECLAKGV